MLMTSIYDLNCLWSLTLTLQSCDHPALSKQFMSCKNTLTLKVNSFIYIIIYIHLHNISVWDIAIKVGDIYMTMYTIIVLLAM